MPSGRTPSLISLNNGGITFVNTKGASKCSRCKVQLAVGVKCGELKKANLGFSVSKRICMECANNILETTQSDLDKIKEEMKS